MSNKAAGCASPVELNEKEKERVIRKERKKLRRKLMEEEREREKKIKEKERMKRKELKARYHEEWEELHTPMHLMTPIFSPHRLTRAVKQPLHTPMLCTS